MARGYIYKTEHGTARVVLARQGRVDEFPNGTPSQQRELSSLIHEAPTGLSRIRATFDGRICDITLGRAADLDSETKRVKAKVESGRGSAVTHSPGVAGYQHMENMANARLQNVHQENRYIVDFLKECAEQRETETSNGEDEMKTVFNNRNDIQNAQTKELVEWYNFNNDGKDIKKFENRDIAIERCLALFDQIAEENEGAKPAPAPKPEVSNADRSEAVAQTWTDPKVAAKRKQRSAVEVDGEQYKSVGEAFRALDLPLSKAIRFRIDLKEAGELEFEGRSWKIIPLNY